MIDDYMKEFEQAAQDENLLKMMFYFPGAVLIVLFAWIKKQVKK